MLKKMDLMEAEGVIGGNGFTDWVKAETKVVVSAVTDTVKAVKEAFSGSITVNNSRTMNQSAYCENQKQQTDCHPAKSFTHNAGGSLTIGK